MTPGVLILVAQALVDMVRLCSAEERAVLAA